MKMTQGLYPLILLLFFFEMNGTFAQDVTVAVNATTGKRAVSPYIYGANNWFDKPARFYKDAGLKMARTNGGNNATKYNWRKKISSHPDWYNNVYANDWDKMSQQAQSDHPGVQVMWAFQLLGRAASNTNHNFNDWGYNQSQWWQGVNQNLAGGGTPNTSGVNMGKAAVEGDVNLYTEPWPADSTVGILDHWFGPNGIGLDKNQFVYWDMDNEPDVWNGTHDDVMDTLISASEFMDRYIEVAKKARALFPEIKLCGPVTTSEWQWFRWGDESIRIDGKYYCWLEYFIKRCADEEKASGVRVLDVVDLHNYPYAATDADALQLHRMYYDKNYAYPGANGLHTINGGWDTSLNKEYIFQRIEDWLTKYFGADNGIGLGISEWSPASSDPNVASVVYASHLGAFANHGVEYFTPWSWYTGMWETLHLFSKYAKNYSVSSTSSLENTVSAYTTVNTNADSMTVIIVNRDMKSARNVTVNLNGFFVSDGAYKTLQLASLPSAETFKSSTDNALKQNSVTVSSGSFTLSVPALSTTAVLLKSSVNDYPPVIAASDKTIDENTTDVETVTATDADAGDSKAYSITGTADDALFTIDPASGALSFVTAPDFENPADADHNNVYVLTVTVTDGAGHTDSKTINVTVADVNDNQPIITASDTIIDEKTTAVETVTATDADAGDSLTFSITGTNDDALFTIDPVSGALSFIAAPDFANPVDGDHNNVYVLTVTVTDGAGQTDSKTISVSVANPTAAKVSVRRPGQLQIFPNPASDKLYISMGSGVAGPAGITISDLEGRNVLSSKAYYDGVSSITIDISNIPNGFYLLSVRKSDGVSVQRFVVSR